MLNKFPFKRGTGVPELKLSPANSPKYQLAASFCENSKEELTIKREEKDSVDEVAAGGNQLSNLWIALIFILGLVSGVLLMMLKPWKLSSKEKTFSIKDPKTLLIKLFPYRNDVQVQKIIDALEKNIYSDAKIDIDKKLLKEIVKKYKLV